MARLSNHRTLSENMSRYLWLRGPKAGDYMMHFDFGWFSNIGSDNIEFE